MTAFALRPLRRWRPLVAAIVTVAALAGCSNDDGDAATERSTSDANADATTTTSTTTTTTTAPPTTTSTAAPGDPVPHVTLTAPTEDATVQPEEPVEGTATGLPPGRELWLVVVTRTGDYHPQDPVSLDSNGQFYAEADFGNANDGAGERYKLLAVVVDGATAQRFRDYVADPQPDGLPGGRPADVEPLATVDVVR